MEPGDLDRLDVGEADGRATAPRAAARAAPPRRAGTGARRSSASVFHSPQPGQRPCHFGSSWPQAEQVKTVAGRAMDVLTVGGGPDGFAPWMSPRANVNTGIEEAGSAGAGERCAR